MNSEQNRPVSGHVPRIAYRLFSWIVTGFTVVLFLLLVVSAVLTGLDAGPANASMMWSAYHVARNLAVSLVAYLVMPFVPVVIVLWALSDGSSDEDGSRASIPLLRRVLLLVMFAALARLQESVSVSDAVDAIRVEQVAAILGGFCVAVAGIPFAVSRFLGGRDNSEETGCSESTEREHRTVADTEDC
jgi:hypothetical protein